MNGWVVGLMEYGINEIPFYYKKQRQKENIERYVTEIAVLFGVSIYVSQD